MEERWKKIIMQKMTFVHRLRMALTYDDRSGVENLIYNSSDFNEPEFETVSIKYKGAPVPTVINVTGNSMGAICQEIIREVYGPGAHGVFAK